MKFRDVIYEWLLFENKEEIYKKYYSDIERENFIRIIKADPRTKVSDNVIQAIGPYSKILLNMYKNDNLKFEDLPKATEYLTLVYKHKIPVDAKTESIAALYELVKPYIVKSEKTLKSILEALPKEEYKVFLNAEGWYVFIPITQKAASYLGVNTQWCTTWGEFCLNPDYKDRSNHFASHNKTGPLYIMINKENESDKYQLHFPTDQLKNPADNEINNRPTFFNERLELKRALFPFMYSVDLSADEMREGLSKTKKFLSEQEYDNLLQMFIEKVGVDNDLVSVLASRESVDEETLLKYFQDKSIKEIEINRKGLEMEVRELTPSAESHYNAISYLRMAEREAYNDVYEEEYSSWDSDSEWVKDMLDGYLESFYKENVTSLKEQFGYAAETYETFKEQFLEDMIGDDNIRDGYIDKFSEGTGAAASTAYNEEMKKNAEYLDIDGGYSNTYTIVFSLESLIEYVAKKEIKIITDLDDFIENYMFEYDLASGDYYDRPEYDHVSPTQEDMDNVFEKYFNKLADDFERYPECDIERKKLQEIVHKYYNNGVYENDFVKIVLIKTKLSDFDCEKGIEIQYTNKKNNETYEGYVKVDNLMNNMQMPSLFEGLSLSKILSNIL